MIIVELKEILKAKSINNSKKNRKAFTVRGTKEHNIKAVPVVKTFPLYAGRFEPNITINQIKLLAEESSLRPLKVIKLITKQTRFSSFRIIIENIKTQKDIAFNERTCPKDILIRKYFYIKRETQQGVGQKRGIENEVEVDIHNKSQNNNNITRYIYGYKDNLNDYKNNWQDSEDNFYNNRNNHYDRDNENSYNENKQYLQYENNYDNYDNYEFNDHNQNNKSKFDRKYYINCQS